MDIVDELAKAEFEQKALTLKAAERETKADCRQMYPTSVNPNCDFLCCQVGRQLGERFHLISFGNTWNAAVKMFRMRRRKLEPVE